MNAARTSSASAWADSVGVQFQGPRTPAKLQEQVIVRREPKEICVVPFPFPGFCALICDADNFTNARFVQFLLQRLPGYCALLRLVDFHLLLSIPPNPEREGLFVQAKLAWARGAVEDLI